MARVMISCPNTDEPVFTGIDMGEDAFQNATLAENTILHCPHCGQTHTWSKNDAYLEEPGR